MASLEDISYLSVDICFAAFLANDIYGFINWNKMEKRQKGVLAIDFGASSGRAMLGTLEDGKIRLREIHRFSNDPVTVGGVMYWDILPSFQRHYKT